MRRVRFGLAWRYLHRPEICMKFCFRERQYGRPGIAPSLEFRLWCGDWSGKKTIVQQRARRHLIVMRELTANWQAACGSTATATQNSTISLI